MPVDNTLYETHAETWWDENGLLHLLRSLLNPARFGYFREILIDRLGRDPQRLRVLDVGCGGGLLAEEFARIGCRVSGIDPSPRSIAVARDHASAEGLEVGYGVAMGEALPFGDERFEVATCCDVLEHVDDLDMVIQEIARVLVPGGIFFYDTLNRTRLSKLVMIKLFQQWEWSRFMYPGTHDWEMFITPRELHSNMAWHGLANRDVIGLRPRANALKVLWTLGQRRRGRLGYADLARRLRLTRSRNTRVLFMGYAVKK
jgi:2-polyprenyl-6-hydroxyphenyl methylase / 3-demethylubiquinone-9 3-methyltransferase